MSRVHYELHQIIGGRRYVLAGLGTFRSGLEARTKWESEPRNHPAEIVEVTHCVRHGVEYGFRYRNIGTARA